MFRCIGVLVAGPVVLSAGAYLAPTYAASLQQGLVPGAPGLPDQRVYEQVSPAAKNGNQAGPGVQGGSPYGVAAADGGTVLYSSTGPIGEASSGVDNFSVSARTAESWTTRAAIPQPPQAQRDLVSPFDPIWLLPSADLSTVTFTAHNPFTPVALDYANPEFSFVGAYLARAGAATAWLGAPTVEDPFPALEEVENPASLVLAGASSDMRTVYYEYYGTLVPEDAPRRPTVAGGNKRAWGLYEWRDGQLRAAGVLPSGEEDPYGAMAAAVGEQTLNATPSDFDNEVSRNGTTALFVSPVPTAESGRTPQLYARLDGSRTVLISRSELTLLPSLKGPAAVTGLSQSHIASYAYVSPDGSKVFFASQEQLTSEAPADTSLKEYQFDLITNTLTYLSGVTPPILAASESGSTVVFDAVGSGEQEHHELAMYSGGRVTRVAALPPPNEGQLYVSPVRLAAQGNILVFQTNAAIAGFNNGEGLGEVYRYDVSNNGLGCVSCPPEGKSPAGTANLSNDALHHLTHLIIDSRGVSEDGSEIFFDTPDRLVPQDVNESRDVYEWHDGRISLISSGTGSADSLFLDNSASGGDVFFATRDDLTGFDTDGSYDVYDARVGGGFPPPSTTPGCATGCRMTPSPLSMAISIASTSDLGVGESVTRAPSPGGAKPAVSRARSLARSLKACRRKRGSRRRHCEAQARRRYGKHKARSRS
jgi:hypothetical protein